MQQIYRPVNKPGYKYKPIAAYTVVFARFHTFKDMKSDFSNSLDPDQTPSNSASDPDPICLKLF